MKWLDRVINIITKTEAKISIVALGIMFFANSLEVISRNLFNYSYYWVQELTMVFLCWEVFMGAAYVYNTYDLMNVDFIYIRTKGKIRVLFDIVNVLVTFIVLLVLIVYGWKFQIVQSSFKTTALHLPQNIYSLPLVICACSMMLGMISKLSKKLLRTEQIGGEQ